MQSLLPGARCFLKKLFVYLFIFGCTESSLLCVGFLLLWRVGATLCCDVWASHSRGFLLQSTGARCSGYSSCGLWASLLHGMWNLPGPGIEPMSPALAGELPSTIPSGKSWGQMLATRARKIH